MAIISDSRFLSLPLPIFETIRQYIAAVVVVVAVVFLEPFDWYAC
jgi:hypothetical protein